MLETPVFEASAPLTWGVEGISFPLEEIRTTPLEEILAVDPTPYLKSNLNPVFNTQTSALINPEIEDFTYDEKIEEFFTLNDLGNGAMETFKTLTEMITENTDFSQPESIWGYKTFDEDDIIMCAPPAIVEGTDQQSNIERRPATKNVTVEEFYIENNDVLKWIIDDQQIDDLPALDNSKLELTPVNHSVPLLPESFATIPFVVEEIPLTSPHITAEVKTEELGDDEKYRKMRSQNNEASKKCRISRKRKQDDMEVECELLQERNAFLKSRLEDMEQEVKAWKKKLLSDIASTSKSNNF